MTLKRILIYTAVSLITLPSAAYLADYAVWRIKQSHGNGMATVTVSRIVVASLKGGKEEYYPDGTADLDCSNPSFHKQAAEPAGGSSGTTSSLIADALWNLYKGRTVSRQVCCPTTGQILEAVLTPKMNSNEVQT